MKKMKNLKICSEDFLKVNGYELYFEKSELKIRGYKNQSRILVVDFDNQNMITKLIRNTENLSKEVSDLIFRLADQMGPIKKTPPSEEENKKKIEEKFNLILQRMKS